MMQLWFDKLTTNRETCLWRTGALLVMKRVLLFKPFALTLSKGRRGGFQALGTRYGITLVTSIVSSRLGPVEMIWTGQPTNSSIRLT